MVRLFALLVIATSAWAQTSQPAVATTQFSQSDPRSSMDAMRKLARLNIDKGLSYDITQETYALYVPKDYDGTKPFGLFVWISAGKRGDPPGDFGELMEAHHLIYLSADNSGNDRPVPERLALALDAAWNAQKSFHIDPTRIYAGGISGGAKMASILPVIYSDTFCGTLSVVGVVYYRPIQVTDGSNEIWAPVYYPPAFPLLERAKSMNRFVMITGSTDMNHDSIQRTFRTGFKLDRFIYADYVEVPSMGHQMPPKATLDAALTKLDEPLPGLMGKYFQLAGQAQRTKHADVARALYEAVALHGEKTLAAQAKKQLDK